MDEYKFDEEFEKFRKKVADALPIEARTYPVVGQSNGHTWINAAIGLGLISCRDCGIIRRRDDGNKPCPGKVSVGPRT